MTRPPPKADLARWLDGLARDPEVFPHQLDTLNRRLLLVRLPARQVRESTFLDQRVLTGHEPGVWVPLADALAHRLPAGAPRGIVLHCGHAGSTLITRLLGELPQAWVLREPLVLQSLAAEARGAGTPRARLTRDEFDATLTLTFAAFAKTPPGTRSVVVKHTSVTANLGPALLALPSPPAVLCLWVPLADYLATMLREPGLREGVRLAAGEWIQDVAAELGDETPALAGLADAELAALNWTASQLAFLRTRAAAPTRVLGWPFEHFLADPAGALAELAAHFGLPAQAEDIERALAGPWLRRYAKDPRYPFNPTARRRELDAATRRLGGEIAAGTAFAERLWQRLPLAEAFTAPG